MTRTLLSGLAAVAVLAVLAAVPADAQQLKQRSGAFPGHPGGISAAMGHGHTQLLPQRPLQMRGAGRQPSAVMGSSLLALRLYAQKCLDNLLPQCP